MLGKRLCFLAGILFILVNSLTYTDEVPLLQYEYITDFHTERLNNSGKSLRTSGSILSNIDPVYACRLLQQTQYYNYWVIPGLNASGERLHPPMAVHNSLLADEEGDGLLLNFSLVSPIHIQGITIPFRFDALRIDEQHTRIEIRLSKQNIAVRDAVVDIEMVGCDEGTILNTAMTVDYTFLIDLFLNYRKYAENTEERMRLLIENFMQLSADEIALRSKQ